MLSQKHLVILITLVSSYLCSLPSTIRPCSRNLPNPAACILAATEKLRPLLAQGNLGDGFLTPPLEPLFLDTINMNSGEEFYATLNNILINGPSNFIIEKLIANIPDLEFDFTVLLPKLNFTGNYDLKIIFLILNFQGKGEVNGSFDNTKLFLRVRGAIEKRNGLDYVRFKQFDVKIQIGECTISLQDFSNRSTSILNEIGSMLFNENSELFLSAIIPGLENSLSETFLDIINVVLKNVTFDEMFPDT